MGLGIELRKRKNRVPTLSCLKEGTTGGRR